MFASQKVGPDASQNVGFHFFQISVYISVSELVINRIIMLLGGEGREQAIEGTRGRRKSEGGSPRGGGLREPEGGRELEGGGREPEGGREGLGLRERVSLREEGRPWEPGGSPRDGTGRPGERGFLAYPA